MRNPWLLAGGILSAVAAILHISIIFGGPSWYRFFGAGERLAHFAERGLPQPAIFAVGIATVLAIWAAYAFSGAGVVRPLPFLRPVLVAICAVYLLRAAALPLMLATPRWSATFLYWSSAIVLVFGLIHVIGIVRGWSQLAPS